MNRIQAKAVDAFKAMGDVSREERVSLCAHLLKCSVCVATGCDSEAAQADFNQRVQAIVDEFLAAWSEGA